MNFNIFSLHSNNSKKFINVSVIFENNISKEYLKLSFKEKFDNKNSEFIIIDTSSHKYFLNNIKIKPVIISTRCCQNNCLKINTSFFNFQERLDPISLLTVDWKININNVNYNIYQDIEKNKTIINSIDRTMNLTYLNLINLNKENLIKKLSRLISIS